MPSKTILSKTLPLILASLFLLGLLSACGQTGPLYLPEESESHENH